MSQTTSTSTRDFNQTHTQCSAQTQPTTQHTGNYSTLGHPISGGQPPSYDHYSTWSNKSTWQQQQQQQSGHTCNTRDQRRSYDPTSSRSPYDPSQQRSSHDPNYRTNDPSQRSSHDLQGHHRSRDPQRSNNISHDQQRARSLYPHLSQPRGDKNMSHDPCHVVASRVQHGGQTGSTSTEGLYANCSSHQPYGFYAPCQVHDV